MQNIPETLYPSDTPAAKVVENLDDAKKAKTNEIKNSFDKKVSPLLKGYPQLEKECFPILAVEALNFIQDNNADTTMIDAVIAESGETKEEFVQIVITKSKLFKQIAGAAIGKRRKAYSSIHSAATTDELKDILL